MMWYVRATSDWPVADLMSGFLSREASFPGIDSSSMHMRRCFESCVDTQAHNRECTTPTSHGPPPAHSYINRYWDVSLDAGNFSSSTVIADFGGDGSIIGSSGTPCITSGPFAGYKTLIGPGYYSGDEACIHRQVNDSLSLSARPELVDGCLALESFDEAWRCLERGPHNAGHGGVGGLVSRTYPYKAYAPDC